jgi:hypothetical protein
MDKKEYLMETEDLTAVRIRDYFVGIGRIHSEFMDWNKLWITGFLDVVHRLVFYVKDHNISESRTIFVSR